jgi:hypothetical protein
MFIAFLEAQSRGLARRTADKICTRYQSEDRQGDQSDRSRTLAAASRRHRRMTAFGAKRTNQIGRLMSVVRVDRKWRFGAVRTQSGHQALGGCSGARERH